MSKWKGFGAGNALWRSPHVPVSGRLGSGLFISTVARCRPCITLILSWLIRNGEWPAGVVAAMLTAQTTPNPAFRPSPLSFGSNRTSPFRRPSTPNSPPGRPATPGSSPSRVYTPTQSPSKLNQSYTVDDNDGPPSNGPPSNEPIPQPNFTREQPPSPTKKASSPSNSSTLMGSRSHVAMGASNDSAAQLAPEQLREIREAFQVLDRDNDGSVTRDDVANVLQNVGTL